MKRLFLISALMIWVWSGMAQEPADSTHPRIFMRKGEQKALVDNIAADAAWTQMHEAFIEECDFLCNVAPMERILEGPRLHGVSCEVLRRVLFLSYGWRTTGEERFAKRAEKEALQVCRNFVDWNPKHFLDVAEMTVAVAIAYDWLYDWLSEGSKAEFVEAIVTKGLEPSLNDKYNQAFVHKKSRYSNWGQVCHGGLAIGAIAVHTERPEIAERIIARSEEYIKLPMGKAYPPEGCYPEGFGYWAFGTQYNILFIAAMESYFGSERVEDYKAMPGFVESGTFSQQLITPMLKTFGYSDNSTRIYLEPATMWFNLVRPDAQLYYMQARLFEEFNKTKSYVKTIKNRLMPLMLVWGAGFGEGPTVHLANAEKPTKNFYLGKGENSVCVIRTGWTKEDIYLGVKSGRPDNFHGHMDIGSFYLEADGVRWSTDLGSDHYGDIAKAKVSMFKMTQDSPRWNVLTKYNNFAHSTTYPEGVYQKVDGQCYFEEWSDEQGDMFAQTDITPVYEGHLNSLVRRVSLRGKRVNVEDKVVNGDKEQRMVWNMTTMATEAKVNYRRNRITLYGVDTLGIKRTLELKVQFENRCEYEVEFAPATNRNDYENDNKGASWLRIKYALAPQEKQTLKVALRPKK